MRAAQALLTIFAGLIVAGAMPLEVRATEYTLALPADLPGDHYLCDVEAVGPHTRELIAHFLYNHSPRPLPDGQAIDSSNRVPPYTAMVEMRAGVRTLVVDGPVDNVFNVRAGFCGPAAGPGPAPYVNVTGRLTGGSPDEEKRDGYFDGSANVWIDFCDAADAFDASQEIHAAVRQAAEMHPDVHLEQKQFVSDDKL
jgi:hypothetical protein